MFIFVAAIHKERKTYLLYSFTITTTNKRATTIIGAAPAWAQISRI